MLHVPQIQSVNKRTIYAVYTCLVIRINCGNVFDISEKKKKKGFEWNGRQKSIRIVEISKLLNIKLL